jgi:hypothetical protein
MMSVDPGVVTGVAVTNITHQGVRFEELVKGLAMVRDANRGIGGKGAEGKLDIKWGELPVTTDAIPGSFVAWFQIGPARGPDSEYWTAVLLCDLVEWCGVDWLAIEDFILRIGKGSSGRDGLSAVRITANFMALLRERKLTAFSGIRGGVPNRMSQRGAMRLGNKGGCRVVWQSPADAKGVFTDARLRQHGLWVVGNEHARDAMRHLALMWRKVEGQTKERWDAMYRHAMQEPG